MMYKIIPFSKVADPTQCLFEIKEIFYEASSVKTFRDEEHRKSFFEKWCGDYLTHSPDEFYLMIDIESNRLLGYLSGELNSLAGLEYMHVPGQLVFKDLFTDFPAHLHINFHASTRGQGLGSKLMDFFIDSLCQRNIKGVHLVTSPDALNVSFYNRLGFNEQIVREHNGSKLLFMGKKLIK